MARPTDDRSEPDSPRPAATVALACRAISRRFGPLQALDEVSLTVRAGQIVAVVGENGAGKSTLVRAIVGDLDLDSGVVEVAHATPAQAPGRRASRRGQPAPAVGVVWQDLDLCDDLDVVANVFLGGEQGRPLLSEARMRDEAYAALGRVGASDIDVRAAVDELSRGQRQQVALARTLVSGASTLVLDEPTTSLGVVERAHVIRLLRELRDDGRAILLVTHDLDEAFALADRIVVLRHGRVVQEVSPLEVHPDDVTALMSGIETESAARRQLRRLRSLVDQLSYAAPSAWLPILVSAAAAALDQEQLCLHLLEPSPAGPVLRRSAAVGLPPTLLTATEVVPVGADGGTVGLAADLGTFVAEDHLDAGAAPLHRVALDSGIRSAWSTPIVGSDGVLGVITGFSMTAGRPARDRIELMSLYAGHAASAIEREHLLDEVTRRNGVLESLRAMLETLAGPHRGGSGLSAALLALCRGLAAQAVAIDLDVPDRDDATRWVPIVLDDAGDGALRAIADAAPATVERAHRVQPGVARAGVELPAGRGVLVARWDDPSAPDRDALALLDDAARSLGLALEGEEVERARRDVAAARRSQALQRDLIHRLSHELRTPLTAIRGFASTLQQSDVSFDADSVERFLAAITSESARMERLVGDLLDSSAIESGVLRLRHDWTDLRLVLEAARRCVARPEAVTLHLDDRLEPIWADHDRLQQVFVNLLDNAVRHGGDGAIEVVARPLDQDRVEVQVRDQGPGVPAELAGMIFESRVRGSDGGGAGLGLSIARGIAEAHGGRCVLDEHAPLTTFRVELPVEPGDVPTEPVDDDAGRAVSAGG